MRRTQLVLMALVVGLLISNGGMALRLMRTQAQYEAMLARKTVEAQAGKQELPHLRKLKLER